MKHKQRKIPSYTKANIKPQHIYLTITFGIVTFALTVLSQAQQISSARTRRIEIIIVKKFVAMSSEHRFTTYLNNKRHHNTSTCKYIKRSMLLV